VGVNPVGDERAIDIDACEELEYPLARRSTVDSVVKNQSRAG
jgi:hypothetical protein